MPKLYKIRPLVFVERENTQYQAQTKSLCYMVWKHGDSWYWNCEVIEGWDARGDCTSLEEAKAQAQAHYERELAAELEEVSQ